jgi:Starch-binding associating with outer membrane
MKLFSLNRLKGLALMLTVVYMSSCQKALDINVDPNKALTASPELVLPAAQLEMALPIGNQWNYTGSMWGQYWTGGHGVSSSGLEYYTMQSVDVEGSWTRAYERCLADFDYLIKSGQPVYSGMAKISSAYQYHVLTDLFGDIPYSEALKGNEGNFTPKFDTPESVYDNLIILIDQGMSEIQQSGTGILQPGNDDLYYGGDIDGWIKFANTLKLKILVRRGNYTAAKALIDGGAPLIQSNADNAQFTWQSSASNTNPLWARFNSRIGIEMYYVATTTIIDTLVGLNDPRVDYFFTKPTLPAPGSAHKGVIAGDINEDPIYLSTPPVGGDSKLRRNNFSNVNPVVFSPTTPTLFISAWESKFLQAEVAIRTGGDGSVLFAEAVQTSFDFLGAGDASAYVSSLSFGGSVDNQLNILGIQKWISMTALQMIEGWLETLRFDRAGNNIFTQGKSVTPKGVFTSPILNSLGVNKFPTSFVYPTQEISLNPNTPNRVVTDRRFWDPN